MLEWSFPMEKWFFPDVLQRALLCVGSCLWTADVWLCWLAEQLWSRREVQELLSCPAATQGSSAPRPQLLEPCSPWPGGCRELFGPGDELVIALTQSPCQDQPRAGAVHVLVPFLAVHHAAGPSHTLLKSQGQCCVWVGDLLKAPKIYCVF